MKLIQKLSVVSLFFASVASAGDLTDLISTQDWIALQQAEAKALNIDWKVGDQLSYQVSIQGMGRLGTSVKQVAQDTGTTLWIKNEMNLMVQKEVVEMEIRKSDGQVVKMRRNGQDQELPSNDIEIISSEEASVTVPAGTFQAVHITAKTPDVEHIEVWMNPRDTCMEGTLKQAVKTQFGLVIMELTSFKKN
jgi:hypothetical protein